MACRRAGEAAGRTRSAPDPLDLLPTGFPPAAGRRAARGRARRDAAAAVLPTAQAGSPRDAVVLGPAVGRDRRPARARPMVRPPRGPADPPARCGPGAGRRRRGLGELVEQLPVRSPDAARASTRCSRPRTARRRRPDELGARRCRWRDGRVVHGARGAVLVDDVRPRRAALDALVAWGLRVVHPDAAHPVLERLGAQRVDAAALTRTRCCGTACSTATRTRRPCCAPPGRWRPPAGGPELVVARRCCPRPTASWSPARGLVLPGSPARGGAGPGRAPAGLGGGGPPVGRRAGAGWGCAPSWSSSGSTSWWPTSSRTGPSTSRQTGAADDGDCWR